MEGEQQNWRWIFPQMSLGGASFKTNTFFTWSAIIIIAILKKLSGQTAKAVFINTLQRKSHQRKSPRLLKFQCYGQKTMRNNESNYYTLSNKGPCRRKNTKLNSQFNNFPSFQRLVYIWPGFRLVSSQHGLSIDLILPLINLFSSSL